ncbi:type I-E CRISPR-associated protein Cas6/Cse3/CasE [Bifidobacterium ruminantium]|uniref:CRISPR-associated protein, Cse3 family n=1 Tax=Bifidobacterium ruminantium TaxID=78346 RepID=A0A087D3U0_BIFRU|nr:type I-E CRISPR-associated protein Cas6/Cse3/CasE [Bifidobacterium ruminantium]KFI90190.1 CRISPR-associated protein, Cse3 family [Bifidobacterium ruminantium]
MFISRIPLNKARYGARQLIGSPYKLHAAVECSFPPDAVRKNDEGRILWRLDALTNDKGVWLYVVSPEKPDFTHIVEQAGWPMHEEWETKNYAPLLERIAKGQQWHFRLRANPVRKASEDRGRRHRAEGIVGKIQGHVTVDQQMQWLIDRSASHGFRILDNEAGQPDVIVKERHKEQFKRGNAIVTLATAVFEGHLEVTDADLFRGTLCHGVGRAKGFGCGLLTVASETENRAE